jgi:Tfp pilus assembly protein PilF
MLRTSYGYTFAFVVIAIFVLPPLCAQTRQKLQIPVQMSGKVLMDDGTPPPEPVQVEVFCGSGAGVPIAFTDSKGGFVVRPAVGGNVMDARQPSGRAGLGASGSGAPSVIPPGCSVRARLAGYESSSVVVIDSVATDLGTIVLRRIAGVEGTTTSVTGLNAPKNARQAFEKAQKAIEKKKWDQARAQLENATRIYPQYAAAWYDLGRVHQDSGDLAQARHAYEQAIAADQKYIKPYLQLATVCNQERKWHEMVGVTATVIKLNPYDFAAAYVLNAIGSFRVGDAKTAETSAREALKLDTEHAFPEAEYTLGLALGVQGDYKGAVEHLRNFLKLIPDSPSAGAVKNQLADFERRLAAAP